MRTFEGVMTALATPFRNGKLDEAAYEKLVDYQLENAVSGLVSVGTTGETPTLSEEEQRRLISICVKKAEGKAAVIAGAGSYSTEKTLLNVKRVRDLGADGALVVTPYYNRPTQRCLIEHYKAIAKANRGFPLIAYNVPTRTGVDILPDTLKALCEEEEVVALKEASGSGSCARMLELVEKCGKRLTLLSGDDGFVWPCMASGGRGVISVSSNVAPKHMGMLVEAALRGDGQQALKMQLQMAPLHRALSQEANPIPVKKALHLMGFFADEMRLPLLPLSPQFHAPLNEALMGLGLLP
ncbi:MAG: 4-hydroxy-tetrahydrodipicolinate synthase [Proteobacteria bacterium]|nr:4-hydroxy-tetrahydrodipicolinate synthase [Cystobacterineae bacterium]MCL2259399.1 4-hydroxy-tetrahydrodipicolinate synthase [Cystobacterineae bacterium]MCL2314139.1 4-hydroxy-tetrahydrodipicolinate synthase [Pseudomonadota bacterium]